MTGRSGARALEQVRAIADFQFGRGAGEALFPEGCRFVRSRTRRIRQVMLDKKRLVTLRAQDGRFTLGIEGARRLKAGIPAPAYRVVMMEDAAEFVAQGKNAFAKHVIAADPGIRPGDEVLVVREGDDLLGTGEAALSGDEMMAFDYGVAVKVRKGGK